jgi:hypothetical protein
VKEVVEKAVLASCSVLIKHNMLTTEATQMVKEFADYNLTKSGTKPTPNENLVRVWRTAHKLRQWFLQRYQEMRSAIKEGEEELDKNAVYGQLCNEVISRCNFLMDVVPVPKSAKAAAAGVPGAPGLERQPSTDQKKAGGDVAGMDKPALNRAKSNPRNISEEEDKKVSNTFLVFLAVALASIFDLLSDV